MSGINIQHLIDSNREKDQKISELLAMIQDLRSEIDRLTPTDIDYNTMINEVNELHADGIISSSSRIQRLKTIQQYMIDN